VGPLHADDTLQEVLILICSKLACLTPKINRNHAA
jgi:hypothetical protein